MLSVILATILPKRQLDFVFQSLVPSTDPGRPQHSCSNRDFLLKYISRNATSFWDAGLNIEGKIHLFLTLFAFDILFSLWH